MKETEYVVIGKLGATYGIKGWLKVHSFTDPMTSISDYNPWYLEYENHWESVVIEACRPHGKSMIAKLKGQHTPEQARLLTGKKIAIKRSDLPKLAKNEYYWDDLIGLTVIDQNNKTLGTVVYLIETGANDVLVVKGNKEFGIPYLPDVVISIDLKTKIMHVNWEEF